MTSPYPGNTRWPDNFAGCTLQGTYVALDGTPVQGSVSITATPDVLLDYAAFKVIVPVGLQVPLDANGHFSIVVPATDDADINPQYWTYAVTENFLGGRRYNVEAPQGQTVDIVTAAPAPNSTGNPVVRGPSGQSITAANFDTAGNLVLRMSDETTIVVGSVAGQQTIDGGAP